MRGALPVSDRAAESGADKEAATDMFISPCTALGFDGLI
jgi:hypothetical protein